MSTTQLPPAAVRRREGLLVVLPGVLLAALLTGWNYSSKPMWRDEWYTYGTVERSFDGMVHLLSHTDGGLAGFYLLMHVWMLPDASVAWMRLPAALCTVLVAALTALVGRRVGGTAVGVVSGVVVTMIPAVFSHAQEARAYPLVLAAVTATGLAALRYGERPSTGRWGALAALGFLAAALHPLPGTPAVAGIFIGLLAQPGAAPRWRIVMAGVPAALVSAALIVVGYTQVDVTSVGNSGSIRQAFTVRYLMTSSYALLLVMLALSALAAVVLWRRRARLAVLVGWVVAPVGSLVGLITLGSFFQTRYASAVAPAAAVLIAVGLVAVATLAARAVPLGHGALASRAATVVVTLALVAFLTPTVVQVRTRPFSADDPRSATAALTAGYRSGDAVVYASPTARGLTCFYSPPGERLADPLLVRSPLASNSVDGAEVQNSQVGSATSAFERVWVAGTTSGPTSPWYDQRRIDLATAGRPLVESRSFGEYRLQLWGTRR